MNLTVATLASHTALQILRAAKKQGFKTAAITEPGREKFYSSFGFIDKTYVARPDELEMLVEPLRSENAVFIPHGSFVEYCGPRRAASFNIPFFGLRQLIGVEAVQAEKMALLESAGIPTPKTFQTPEEAEPPVIVKLEGAKGGRGYLLARDRKTLLEKLPPGPGYIIQEYVLGVPAYIHYFASPMFNRVELFGADIRYESNVDGRILGLREPSFVVVGNRPLVLRESLLPQLIEYGERFASAVRRRLGRDMVGPFCLEAIITDELEVKVFEFSGRIVAGTNVYMGVGSPYSALYFDGLMDMGMRISLELKTALERNMLDSVTT